MCLLHLPASLSCKVLSLWVDLKSLVRLHTASCFSDERDTFHDLLDSKELIFRNHVDLSRDYALKWLICKRLKVEMIELGCVDDLLHLSMYFREFGGCIRRVNFKFGCCEHALDLTAIYCQALDVVYSCGEHQTAGLCEILHFNPALKELRLQNVGDGDTQFFKQDFKLQLQRFSLTCLKSFLHIQSFPWSTFAGPQLTKLNLENLSWLRRQDFQAIAALCPRLHSFAARMMPVGNTILAEFTAHCPTITSLDLFCNHAVTDEGILRVVQNLSHLRSLVLQDCPGLTHAALGHIATHCKASLVDLAVDVGRKNIHTLATLLRNGRIAELSLSCGLTLMTTELDHVFACMSSVVELCLENDLVSDDTLCLVAKHCPNLVQLAMSSAISSNLDKAPCALACGCPHLRTVITDSTSDILSPAVRCFWNKMRPQLLFTTFPDYNICN